MALLGTLQLELSAPTDRLSADLDRAQQIIDAQSVAMRRKMERIQKDPILMRVDDRELTALNKHLTSKQEHYKRVQADFAKPLKVSVSYKEINELDRRLKEVGRDRRISLGAGVLPSTLQGVKNSVGRLVLSPITIPVRLAQNAIKDLFKGAMTGIGTELGRSIYAGANTGFKDTYGFNIESKTAQQIGNFRDTNKDIKLEQAINKFKGRVDKSTTEMRYRVGDAVVLGLDANDKEAGDTHDGKAKLDIMRKEAFKDDKLQKEAGNVANAFGDAVSDFSNILFGSKKGMNPISAIVDKQLRENSIRSTTDRTIPLVHERAAELMAAKKTKNTGRMINEDTEEFFIASGGYAGKKGKSGLRISTDINARTGPEKMAMSIISKDSDVPSHVKPVKPDDPTTVNNKGNAWTGLIGMAKSTMKPHLRGYSKDEVEMVAQAVVARETNPNVKIKFIGESGGGFVAQRAADTFGMMGYKNFEYMGVGTPEMIGAMHPDDRHGKKVLSKDEFLGIATDQAIGRLGAARDTETQNVIGAKWHPYEGYAGGDDVRNQGFRKIAEVTNFIDGAPKPYNPEQLKHIKKEGNRVNSIIKDEMSPEEYSVHSAEIFDAWQEVRRHTLVATGKLKKELAIVSDQFQNAYLTTQDDTPKVAREVSHMAAMTMVNQMPEENRARAEGFINQVEDTFFNQMDITPKIKSARKKLNEYKKLHTELDSNRSGSNVDQVREAKNELLEMSYSLDKELNDSFIFGTERAKVESLSRDIHREIHKYSDPGLIGRTPRNPSAPNPQHDPANGLEDYWGTSTPPTDPTPFSPIQPILPTRPTPPNYRGINDPWLDINPQHDPANGIKDYWGTSAQPKNPTPILPNYQSVEDPWSNVKDEVSTKGKSSFVDLEPIIRQFHDAVVRFDNAVNRFSKGVGGDSAGGDGGGGVNVQAQANHKEEVFEMAQGIQTAEPNLKSSSMKTPADRPMMLLAPVKPQRTGEGVQSFTPVAPVGFGSPTTAQKAQQNSILTALASQPPQNAHEAVKGFIPYNAIEQPVSDYLPPHSDIANTKILVNSIFDSLDRQKKQVEAAITKGQVAIARNINNELDADIKEAQSYVERFSQPGVIDAESAQHLRSTVKGNLIQKANFVTKANTAIDLVERGADPIEVRDAPNIPGGLKGFITRGILARRAENARNPNPNGNFEGGYVSPFARVPMMDFMDTPVQSFNNTVEKVKNKFKSFLPQRPIDSAKASPPIDPLTEIDPEKFTLIDLLSVRLGGTFKKLGSDIKALVLGFGGLFIMSKIAEMLYTAGMAAIETSAKFENLAIKITAGSDSVESGRQTYNKTIQTADKYGVSRSGTLETAAAIGGTTFGTELQGKPSETITEQITKFVLLRGLNDNQRSSLTSTVAEMLGSDRVDTRRINELQQSAGITDVRAIGARSMGYSAEQFSAIQQSSTGLGDPKAFVSSFLRQGISDSQLSEGVVSGSINYKQDRLKAEAERGISNTGTPFNALYKSGIDLLTTSLKMLNDNAVGVGNVINGLLISVMVSTIAHLIGIAQKLGVVGLAFQVLDTIMDMPKILKAGLTMAVYTAAFYAMGDGIAYFFKKMSNGYAELDGEADRLGASTSAIGKKGKSDDSELPDSNNEIQIPSTASVSERVAIGLQRNMVNRLGNAWDRTTQSTHYDNPLYNNPLSKALRDATGEKSFTPADNTKPDKEVWVDDYAQNSVRRTETYEKVQTKVKESSVAVLKSAEEFKGKLTEKDIELASLSTEKSGLFASGTADPTKASALTAKFNKAYTERDSLRAGLDDTIKSAQGSVDLARNQKKDIEKDFLAKKITKADYATAVNENTASLKLAEDAQLKLNEAIKSGLTDLLPWTRELGKISAKFEDINIDATNAANTIKIQRNKEEMTGKRTRGQTERITADDKTYFLELKNKEIDKVIKELEFTLNSRDPNAIKNVKKNYNVNSSTSSAQLRVLAEYATSPQDKQVLSQMGVIRDKQNEKLGNVTQISDVHDEAFRKMYEENKSAMLYYVSLAQQLDPVANAFADASAKVVRSKDTFLTKLNNYGTGLFDIYTTAYLGLLDAGKDKLEQQAKLAADKKAAIDAYENRTLAAEGAEYGRFTHAAKLNGGLNTGGRSTTQRNQPVSPQPSSRNNIVPLDRNSGQGVAGQYRGVGNPQNYVDAAELKSRALRDQQLKAADRNFAVAEATSGSELRKIQAIQKLQEDRILIGQVSAKKLRDRNLQALDPNDEIGLQGKQNRARITQDNSLADEKDVKINDVRQLTNSISNQKTTIKELQALKNRTPEQEKALKQTLSDLPRNESTVKSAQADLAGFDKLAASKKASQLEEQKYQLGVSAENIKLDEQTVKAEALKTELTGLNQQLSIQPFNIEGKAKARKIGDAIVEIEARSALIRANRKATEQGRSDEQFDDVADAKARTAAKKNYDRTIANNAKKDAQEALKDKQAFDTETRVFGISGAGIKVGAASMAVRVSGQEDKGNVPFATTNTIQKEYDLKVEEFNKAKKEREDQYQKQIVHYKDSPFLKDVESQYADQNKLAEQGLKNDAIERDRQLNANAIGKRGYEFGQKTKSYDTDTAFKTADMDGVRNRGGDTHEMEFDLAVRAKQKDTASKLVDLQAQRDQITQTGDVADKAKAEIDKLIASTKELAVIDITNISDKFDRFNTVLGKVQSTTLEVFTTWETTGKFDWRKILLSGLDEALKQINTKLMGDLFKPLYRQSEKTATPDTKSVIIQGAESAANMLGTGGGIKNGEPGLLNSDGSVNESDSSSITRSFTPSIAQPQVANPIGQQVQSIVTNGLVKLALPGGGFTTMSKQEAISNGFINLDGTSTTAPKPVPVVEPRTPYVEPIVEEPIDIPPSPIDEYEGFGIPQPGYDIRRLPLPDRRRRASAGITGGGGSGSIGGGGSGIAGSLVSMALPSLLRIFGLKDGDVVKPDPMFKTMREGEDPIAKALRKEGNDAVIAALTPGERVLSLKQTSIYQAMFPQGIENHADGGVAGGITPVELNLDPNKKNGSGDTNFHFDIDNSNRGADGQLQSRQLVEGLRSVVVQELIRQKRNGSGLVT